MHVGGTGGNGCLRYYIGVCEVIELKLLAIEASSEACSVALLRAGEIAEEHVLAPREHTQHILAMIEGLLRSAALQLADLDGIAFGRGPGTFTGVRVAASVTQGLAFGAGLPVIPVSTLAALARGAKVEQGATGILAAIDARMGEVYWAAFQQRGEEFIPIIQEQVGSAESVPMPSEGSWVGVGSGWRVFGDTLGSRGGRCLHSVDSTALPRASAIAQLAAASLARGELCAAESAWPTYLRDDVVQVPR